MELTLKRLIFTDKSTIGALVDAQGKHICHILEDKVRETPGKSVQEWKIKGCTAIPEGRYRVVWDMSNRFKQNTLRLLNVPGFEGIRIHRGNTDKDTEGCLLPGVAYSDDFVSQSAIALIKIESLICPRLAEEEVWITVGRFSTDDETLATQPGGK